MTADTADQHAHADSETEAPDPRRWIALAVLLLAGFMNLIDVTIVNVGLPSLQRNLGATSSDIEWVVAGYVLAFALGLLPFGRLGDIVGRKSIFLAGVAGFTLFSALCGFAPNIEFLVASRALQGLSAAMMMPQVLAIAQVTFPPHERGVAFSLFGLNAGLASVAGPLVGGLLISANIWGLDWRPIFLVNLPVGLFTIVAGWFLIPNMRGSLNMRIDWLGIPMAAATILLLVFPLVEGRGYGWPLWAFAMMALAVPMAFAFVQWERRQARMGAPQLLPIALMSNRNYLFGTIMTTALFSGMPSFFLVFAVFLQTGFGFTPFQSGYTTTPMPLGILVASYINGRLGSRHLKARVAFGMTATLCGYFWLRTIVLGLGDTVDHWWVAPPLAIIGLGIGMTISALFQLALASVPHRDAGSGAGAIQSFQQVGAALGVAIGGEIFFASLGAGGMGHASFVHALSNSILYQFFAFGTVLLLLAFVRNPPQAAPRGSKPQANREPAAPVVTEL
ncbi:MAG TPA: MFS transporter [Devosiaceae bacterium]